MGSSPKTKAKREIGGRVAEARRRAGLTQKQLADLVGVGERAVQGWELGQSHPYRRIATLERILNVNRDWILHGPGVTSVTIAAAAAPNESQTFSEAEQDERRRKKPDSVHELPAELERRLAAIERRLERLERR